MRSSDGRFMDIWWKVGSDHNETRVASEVSTCVTGFCLPALDQWVSIASVYEYARSTPLSGPRQAVYAQIMWAIVAHLYGDTLLAESTWNGLYANRRLTGEWRDRIDKVRERLAGTRFG